MKGKNQSCFFELALSSRLPKELTGQSAVNLHFSTREQAVFKTQNSKPSRLQSPSSEFQAVSNILKKYQISRPIYQLAISNDLQKDFDKPVGKDVDIYLSIRRLLEQIGRFYYQLNSLKIK